MLLPTSLCIILLATFSFTSGSAEEVVEKRYKRWPVAETDRTKMPQNAAFSIRGAHPACLDISADTVVRMGIRAVRQLLAGAKKIDKDVFLKTGNYDKALRDFYGIEPTNVRNSGSKVYLKARKRGKAGVVGNRKIKVEQAKGQRNTKMVVSTIGNNRRDFTIIYRPEM